jgi:hypothetical protein
MQQPLYKNHSDLNWACLPLLPSNKLLRPNSQRLLVQLLSPQRLCGKLVPRTPRVMLNSLRLELALNQCHYPMDPEQKQSVWSKQQPLVRVRSIRINSRLDLPHSPNGYPLKCHTELTGLF